MASHQSNSNRVSTGIGEKLLKGWTLLAEQCPVCVHTPLVRSRAGEMYCVGCDMEVRTEAKAPKNATPAPPAVPSPKASAESISPSPAAASGRSRTDSSFASSAIAQKLLVGWTLLGETCPMPGCLVPLMQDPKTKTNHCVNSTNCGFGSSASAAPASQSPAEKASPARSLVNSARQQEGGFDDTRMSLYFAADEAASSRAPPTPIAVNAPSPAYKPPTAALVGGGRATTEQPSSAHSSLSQTPNSVAAVVAGARSALLSRIDVASKSLGSCTVADDARALVALIRDCAETLKTLEEVR